MVPAALERITYDATEPERRLGRWLKPSPGVLRVFTGDALLIGAGKMFHEFVVTMTNLNLPYQKKMDVAVPFNPRCGDCPEEALEGLRRIGGASKEGS